MPEGPEVYCIADQLQALVAGADIVSLKWGPDAARVAGPSILESLSAPERLQRVYARGKRIVFDLQQGHLVTFLGMTGRWLQGDLVSDRRTESGSPWSHVHLSLTLRKEGREISLHYEDIRRMGELFHFSTTDALQTYLGRYGLDLLAVEPTPAEWVALCKRPRKTTPVYGFLLNPKFNNTVGNYLASEILYYARLHPMRTMGSLSGEELERLRLVSVRVCRYSYSQGGLTISDYLTPDGKMGGYVNVCYGRDKRGDPEGRPIVRGTHGGRSYFFVAELQPLQE